MGKWAIWQAKSGTYHIGLDRGEPLELRRACGVGSEDGGLEIVSEWNRTAALAAAIRKERLTDESSIQMGKDALNEAEEPTDTTPCSTSRLSLVSIQEGAG